MIMVDDQASPGRHASLTRWLSRWSWGVEAALLVLLLLAITLRYEDVRELSWTYDDAFLLRVANSTESSAYFGSPEFWESMPARMFVPVLLVWYELGSRAGAESGFYGLALALLAVSLTTSYIALRMWTGRVQALSAIALIGLGPATVSLVTQLMATHYLIALALSGVAVALYAKAGRAGARGLAGVATALLSALFYLLAMLAKEIAVPLPLLLLLIPGSRRKLLVLHGIALGGYFVWRWLMIGTILGGYGWAVTRENVGALVVSLPEQILQSIGPPQKWLTIVLLLILLLPVIRHLSLWRAVVALAIALAPVLPVSREMQPRYVFPLWVTLAILFAVATRGRVWLCALAVSLTFVANLGEWHTAYPLAERMSVEARFIRTAPPNSRLRNPSIPPAALGELLGMNGAGRVEAFYDDIYLCNGTQSDARTFEYDSGRMAEITHLLGPIAQRHCGSIRADAPLRAHFRYSDGTLYWHFGPYEDGEWSVVLAGGRQAFIVPSQDAFQLPGVSGLPLRVRYRSPDGWVTYSPELALDFVRQPDFRWQR